MTRAVKARTASRPRRSVPLHELAQRRAQIGPRAAEVWMHGQRPAETVGLFLVLLEREVAEALPRQRAEVVRVARDGLTAIRDRARIVLRDEARGRALVPAFRVPRRHLDHAREERLRRLHVLPLHRLDPLAEDRIHLRV